MDFSFSQDLTSVHMMPAAKDARSASNDDGKKNDHKDFHSRGLATADLDV
jgi:hypothetical protein